MMMMRNVLSVCQLYYHLSSVQRMPSHFVTVPRLSTICRLDNIVPCDHSGATDWSTEAKTAFADMTSTRPMRMKVSECLTVIGFKQGSDGLA